MSATWRTILVQSNKGWGLELNRGGFGILFDIGFAGLAPGRLAWRGSGTNGVNYRFCDGFFVD